MAYSRRLSDAMERFQQALVSTSDPDFDELLGDDEPITEALLDDWNILVVFVHSKKDSTSTRYPDFVKSIATTSLKYVSVRYNSVFEEWYSKTNTKISQILQDIKPNVLSDLRILDPLAKLNNQFSLLTHIRLSEDRARVIQSLLHTKNLIESSPSQSQAWYEAATRFADIIRTVNFSDGPYTILSSNMPSELAADLRNSGCCL
jgi:hypothetical protein